MYLIAPHYILDHGVVFTFGKAASGCLGLSTEIDIQQVFYLIKSIICSTSY